MPKKDRDKELMTLVTEIIHNTTAPKIIKETVIENIIFGYKLRNKIVHKSKRIAYKNLHILKQII